MKNLLYFFRIIRLKNALMAAVGIAIGWLYCNSNLAISDLIFRVLAGFFALGYGNIINDIKDVKTDKISHPDRLLPSNKISLRTAVIFAVICVIFSIVAGFLSSPIIGIATIIPLLLLTLYSLFLKATPFAGNLLVAALTAYTLIFGGLGENLDKILYPAILAFLANFAREIVKDLADEEGDKAAGLRTTSSIPLSYVKVVIFLQFIAFATIAPLPFLFGFLGATYMLITASFVAPLHFLYLKYFGKTEYKKAADVLKVQMLVGLFAVVADYFFKL